MRLSVRRPGETADRVRHFVEVRADVLLSPPARGRARPFAEVEHNLLLKLGGNEGEVRAELAAIESDMSRRVAKTSRQNSPIASHLDADIVFARLCYLGARLARPESVVETGVASGVSTTFLLSALEANGSGTVYSIDLPPLGRDVDDYVGTLVPNRLSHRWELSRGTSRRLLGPLAARLGRIGVFVHDALPTYWSQRAELAAVTPYLAEGGVVLMNQVQRNDAFGEWARIRAPSYSACVRAEAKDDLIGVAVL